ncbi:MAG: polysaccharide deacetylase family protein [Gammaproteobacteria bacterium]|nr:polysaccharide deacetylase family protein [Gammaproteobacteria bacterium]MDH5692947.1 polysaccharide deacetylase family protein [Gammaproteobacteria bacterium]
MIHRVLNRAKDIAFTSWLSNFWMAKNKGTILSFLYHRVDHRSNNDFLTKGYSPVISPENLYLELNTLKNLGVNFLTFDKIGEYKLSGNNGVGIIVCFDDCFKDNYEQGFEVLEALNIKATFFQTTALVDSNTLIWEHALYWFVRDSSSDKHLKHVAENYYRDNRPILEKGRNFSGMDWVQFLVHQAPLEDAEALVQILMNDGDNRLEQAEIAKNIYPTLKHLKKAFASGHELGTHGHQHLRRTGVSAERFEEDLKTSKDLFESWGFPGKSYSYPFNSYLKGDENISKKYFEMVATVDSKPITRNTPMSQLPRFTWPGNSPNQFRMRRWLLTGGI